MTDTIFVAGHHFDRYTDRCACGRRWLDIHDADDGCLNQEGWSHTGKLLVHELAQIKAEKARREAVYETAITGRRSGSDEGAPTTDPNMVEF